MYRGGGRRGLDRRGRRSTVPRPLSRFDSHPRWSPVTQSARYRRSYGKIGDCEQSTFSPIHFSQIVVVLYFCTSTDPNGFSVMGTMRSVSMWGSSLGCERDQIGLYKVCIPSQVWAHVKPGSHMPPMYLRHGRRCCLRYCSDMRTEVAANIGHPSLYRQNAQARRR